MAQGQARVLRIIARLNVGGPALHAILLTEGLDRDRYESALVVGRSGPREGDLIELAREKDLPIEVVTSLGRDVAPVSDILSLLRLCRSIRKLRPHIVHTHTAKAGALGRIAAWLCRVPAVVHTFHGSVFAGYFGPVGSRLYALIEKFLASRTDVVVAVSPRLKQDLENRGIRPRHRIEVIPLGLELEPFERAPRNSEELRRELELPSSALLIGSIGRLVPIKDLPTLLAAMKLFVVHTPEAHLVLVGDGPERERLQERCDGMDLAAHVHFLGLRTDLPHVFSDLNIVVNCSINEGTPAALIEAMAAGVPVVGTAVGGTPDLLLGGQLGTLVPPGNPYALFAALCKVSSNRGETEVTTRKAKRWVVEHYTARRLCRDVDRLYSGLIPPEFSSSTRPGDRAHRR